MAQGHYGSSQYGLGPYGSVFDLFGLQSATALSPYRVELVFTDSVDFSFPPILDPTNYTISPTLSVTGVTIVGPKTIWLTTSEQSYVIYEVVIAEARGLAQEDLSPALNSAYFTGYSTVPAYLALGTRDNRVRLLFSAPMLQNSALANPASYTLTDLNGDPIVINSVVVEQATHTRSVILELDSDMQNTGLYQTTISGLVTETGALTPNPATAKFQWVKPDNKFEVMLDEFSGEVQGGLFGSPLGLVFFSPALESGIANSTLQIDEIDVCTTAYDVYTAPTLVDPNAFYTWGRNVQSTTLNQNGVVLWAPYPMLVEASFTLGFTAQDTRAVSTDGPVTAVLTEPFDPDYVSLLNNSHWGLGPDGIFSCADNMSPIPSGTTSTRTLS